MATGLPDNEAVNEEEQTNELDQLNNTMSSVKDVLLAQLESLKSIARWQDQTALYTSHLQNIKVDMNQVRKWGEPISQIAQRVDVIATRMEADADRESTDNDGNVDAQALLPALNEIAANTRMTVEAIQVLADATREGQEDKREPVKEVAQPKQKVDKKQEQGVKKHMSDAMTGVKDFFSKIISWFAMAAMFIAPLMVGPSQLFGTLKEFFGHVRKFFTAITKFFLENVVPAIQFLMDKLVGFFNELSGPLSRLGTELGNALKLVGPKLWNVLSPILDTLGTGIIKAVDFFTVVLGKIGPALDVVGNFVSDIFAKFGGQNEVVTAGMDSISSFFEDIQRKLNAMTSEDFAGKFEMTLKQFWNGTIDTVVGLLDLMVVTAGEMKLPGFQTDQEMLDFRTNYIKPLEQQKFVMDYSDVKAAAFDFSKPDEEIIKDLDTAFGTGNISGPEHKTLSENIPLFRQRQEDRVDRGLRLVSKVDAGKIKETEPAVVGGKSMHTRMVYIKDVRDAIPEIPFKDIYVEQIMSNGKIHPVFWSDAEKTQALGDFDQMDFGAIAKARVEKLILGSMLAGGQDKIGTLRHSEGLDPNPHKGQDMMSLHHKIGQEVTQLSSGASGVVGTAGNNNTLNSGVNTGGNQIITTSISNQSRFPTTIFEGR